jgi:hypothetical protein
MSKSSKQSYHGINYNLRSSKSIERKIILEAIRGICESKELKKFGYVGFGSPFYTDFRLIHKELGINWMVCIEGNREDEERFLFNKPYKCIQLQMGMSNEVLPTLDWKREKNMVWLDYDSPLQPYMFEDLAILSGTLTEGSFLVLTCNGTLPSYKRDVQMEDGRKITQTKIADFKENFEGYFPLDIQPPDFHNNNVPKLLRTMFTNCINEKINGLNRVIEENDKMNFIQLFNQ